MKRLRKNGLVSILSNNLTNLTCLDMCGLRFIPNETLSIMPFPDSLMDLNMAGCGNVDDNTISSIMAHNNLSNLTSLDLSYNENIDLSNILSVLPRSLTMIDLAYGPIIDRITVKSLTRKPGQKPELKIMEGKTCCCYYYFE
eukprot:gene7286-9928_t